MAQPQVTLGLSSALLLPSRRYGPHRVGLVLRVHGLAYLHLAEISGQPGMDITSWCRRNAPTPPPTSWSGNRLADTTGHLTVGYPILVE